MCELTFTQYYNQFQKLQLNLGELNEPNDGNYKQFYSNGNRYSEENFKDGLKHGECKYYHKNGKLKEKVRYKNGLKSGKRFVYAESGEIILTEKYKKDSIVKVVVEDDSLYNYVVKIYPHGKKCFQKFNEHLSTYIENTELENILKNSLEMLNTDSLESISICDNVEYFFREDVKCEQLNNKDHNPLFFTKYDIEAILFYFRSIEKSYTSSKNKLVRMPKYRRRIL